MLANRAIPASFTAMKRWMLMLMAAVAHGEVIEPPAALRRDFDLADHYAKCVMVGPFPVVASGEVADAALLEAAHTVASMLAGRDDILEALAASRTRLGIMAVGERTCDLPEHSDLEPAAFWNRRARGLGATRERPCVSCGEENLLHHPGDPYATESILVHEFAHAIHEMALNAIDPGFDRRLESCYRAAMDKGLWKGLYAGENRAEYWAEAVQSWFDTNRENDAIHNHVDTRGELEEYDPGVAALCREVFAGNDWRYVRADDPSRRNDPHLRGLDRRKLADFGWSGEEEAAFRAVDDGK